MKAEDKLIADFHRIDAWRVKRKSSLTMTKKDLADSVRIELEAAEKKIKAIEEYAATHQEEEGWISVEDRLPNDGDEVLSWADNKFNICDNNIMLSRYIGPSKGSQLYNTDRDKRWFQYIENDACFEHHKVTHWMPRPNPPKSYSDKK